MPSHYGTFPLLTGTPDALRALAPSGVEILSTASQVRRSSFDPAPRARGSAPWGDVSRRSCSTARSTSSGALVLDSVDDVTRLRDAHERGIPVVVRASSADEVKAALARPEVACALVSDASSSISI